MLSQNNIFIFESENQIKIDQIQYFCEIILLSSYFYVYIIIDSKVENEYAIDGFNTLIIFYNEVCWL
jgi:hypothetical protein